MSTEIVQIEVSTKCQLNCLMCPKYWFSDEWIAKDMNMEIFHSIPFKKFGYAHLQGWGEPLLNPKIGEMINLARKYCKVGLTTNGLLLKKHIGNLLKTDLVAVSIASADSNLHEKIRRCKLEEITDGIKLLSEQRSKKKPKITVVTMMLKDTIETLPQIVELASECGADEVIANNLDYIPSRELVGMEVFTSEETVRPEIVRHIRMAEERARELGVDFTHRPVRMEEVLVCAENPVKNCLITVDGLVTPCVYLHLPTSSNHIVRYFNGKMFKVPKVYFGSVTSPDWEKNYEKFRKMFKKRTSLLHYLFSFTLPPLPEVCRTCYKAYSV